MLYDFDRMYDDKIPFIDNPRRFTWTKTYIDVDGSIRDENTTEYRVDLRESVFNSVSYTHLTLPTSAYV